MRLYTNNLALRFYVMSSIYYCDLYVYTLICSHYNLYLYPLEVSPVMLAHYKSTAHVFVYSVTCILYIGEEFLDYSYILQVDTLPNPFPIP